MPALELLRDPRLLERIVEDLTTSGIVGERTNKLVGYLAAVSRKLERPLAILVQSFSSSGKSTLMDAILALMPPEEVLRCSGITGQSLYYLGSQDIQHKILAISEEAGIGEAAYALKLLQSEGELRHLCVGKNEAGRMQAQEYHVQGPVQLVMTTTSLEMDEELVNRCLVLTVDEGHGQTERHSRTATAWRRHRPVCSGTARPNTVASAPSECPASPASAGGLQPLRTAADVPQPQDTAATRSHEVPDAHLGRDVTCISINARCIPKKQTVRRSSTSMSPPMTSKSPIRSVPRCWDAPSMNSRLQTRRCLELSSMRMSASDVSKKAWTNRDLRFLRREVR